MTWRKITLADSKRYLSFKDSSTQRIRLNRKKLRKNTIPKTKRKKVKKPRRIKQATKRVKRFTENTYLLLPEFIPVKAKPPTWLKV